MHRLAQLLSNFQARGTPDFFQDTAILADRDALLTISFHPNDRIDRHAAFFAQHFLNLNRQPIRHLLMQHQGQLFANDLGDMKFFAAIRMHILWKQRWRFR